MPMFGVLQFHVLHRCYGKGQDLQSDYVTLRLINHTQTTLLLTKSISVLNPLPLGAEQPLNREFLAQLPFPESITELIARHRVGVWLNRLEHPPVPGYHLGTPQHSGVPHMGTPQHSGVPHNSWEGYLFP